MSTQSVIFCRRLSTVGVCLAVSVYFLQNSHASETAKEISLSQAIEVVLTKDPQLQAAIASKDVGLQKREIARAGLLPTITATVSEFPGSTTESRIPNATSPAQRAWSETRYDLSTRLLTLRQPLIRPRNWATYLQGATQAQQAEAKLRFDRYEAITRIVEIYANWLSLEKRTLSDQSKVRFSTARLNQVREMRAQGQATLTDEQQARAELQRAVYESAESEKEFLFTNERFSQLVGKGLRPQVLALDLSAADSSAKEFIEHHQGKLLEKSPELQALELAIEVARWDIKKFQADHLPTLDLVANYSEESNATSVFLGRETRTTSAGVQLTIPIYSGGAITNSAKQAAFELNRLQAEYQAAHQRLNSEWARLVGTLNSAIRLRQFAEEQSRFALENLQSIKQQQRLGFKTSVDLEKAHELIATSAADITRAESMWMITKVELLALIGGLDSFKGEASQLLR